MAPARIEPGDLLDYVPSRQLLTPWGQRHGLLRDEEREARLTQHAREKNWGSGARGGG